MSINSACSKNFWLDCKKKEYSDLHFIKHFDLQNTNSISQFLKKNKKLNSKKNISHLLTMVCAKKRSYTPGFI